MVKVQTTRPYRSDLPQKGWTCIGVTDLEDAIATCEMCGKEEIRYVHHCSHEECTKLDVGCVCAGRMTGEPDAAKERERTMQNTATRRLRWIDKGWVCGEGRYVERATKGGHDVVIVSRGGQLFYAEINGRRVCASQKTILDAKRAAFKWCEENSDVLKLDLFERREKAERAADMKKWLSKRWRVSQKGNLYLRNEFGVLFICPFGQRYKFGVVCGNGSPQYSKDAYPSEHEAQCAAYQSPLRRMIGL